MYSNNPTMSASDDKGKRPEASHNATLMDPRVSVGTLAEQYQITPKAIRAFLARPEAPEPIRIGKRIVRYRLSEATAYLDSALTPR